MHSGQKFEILISQKAINESKSYYLKEINCLEQQKMSDKNVTTHYLEEESR